MLQPIQLKRLAADAVGDDAAAAAAAAAAADVVVVDDDDGAADGDDAAADGGDGAADGGDDGGDADIVVVVDDEQQLIQSLQHPRNQSVKHLNINLKDPPHCSPWLAGWLVVSANPIGGIFKLWSDMTTSYE